MAAGLISSPLRCEGASMDPPMVLLARALALYWLLSGHVVTLPSPYLPFLPLVDAVPWPAAVRAGLLLSSVSGSLVILFSRHVRVGCALVGGSLLAGVLASRPFFANNLVFGACLLLLLAIVPRNRQALFVRLQLACLFAGASLDKLLDPDWRAGRVLEHLTTLLAAKGGHTVASGFQAAAAALGGDALTRGLSAAVIACELAIAVALVARASRLAAALTLAFWSGALALTASTFGMFFHATAFASLCAIAPAARPMPWLCAAAFFAAPWFR